MKGQSIYFKGYYGEKNIGDDVFCVTADWLSGAVWPDARGIFIGRALPDLSARAIALGSNSPALRRAQELAVSLLANWIVYFGGSVFHTRPQKAYELKAIYSKRPFAGKLGTIGTSIGPFRESADKDFIKGFLKKFRFVSFRDDSSLAIAREMGLLGAGFSFDPAILIEDVFPRLQDVGRGSGGPGAVVGVSLCHYERYTGGDREKEAARETSALTFLMELVRSYPSIRELVFLEFNGSSTHGDQELIGEFSRALAPFVPVRTAAYTLDTEAFCREVMRCDAVFGMRLHAGILAYALGIPFMLIEYHGKCTEFLTTIGHRFRFDPSDVKGTAAAFHGLMEQKTVPGILPRHQLKHVLYEELARIGQVIGSGAALPSAPKEDFIGH